MAKAKKEDLPALVHRDEFIWELRSLFLKSLQDTAPLAISELLEDIYPLYQEARGELKDGPVGLFSLRHKEGAVQSYASAVPDTPFASYHHLDEAIATRQEKVNLAACLKLKNELLRWAKKYHVSPEYWSSSKDWVLNSVMFDLGSFHFGRDKAAPFHFTMWRDANNKAPVSVTLQLAIRLDWDLAKDSKAQAKKWSKNKASKQINTIVNNVFEHGKQTHEPNGFVAFTKPQDINKDMRWLVAYQCLEKDEYDISKEYPGKKYRKKTNKKEEVSESAVAIAIKNRAKEIGLILRRENKN